MDDKAGVVGILEAIERMLARDVTPKRTVIIALGHDEEVAGKRGAVPMVERLAQRGVRAAFALDEGGAIASGLVPKLGSPVALIGVTEKGYATVNFTVEAKGGHSGQPPPTTSVGILSAAITKLEARPMPPRLDGAMREMVAWLAPEMPFGPRAALTNLWLAEPLVLEVFAHAPATNASIRTTMAATMFHAGVKDNVIPASAKATVNFRILPGDSSAGVLAHVRDVVADDKVRIEIEQSSVAEPSPVSRTTAEGFVAIARTVREVFPGTLVAPSLTLGATDGRHYTRIADDVYRFLPMPVSPTDLARVHGTNERIGVAALGDAVRFYERLLETTTQ
jgi:carboxypeptidase PM20D1